MFFISSSSSSSQYPALELGLISIAGGLCASMVLPSQAAAGVVVGGLAIVVAHFTSRGKYDIIFHNLKICTHELYPVYVAAHEHDGSTVYEYTVPAGLDLSDFEKHHDALEVFAACPVELSIHNKRLFLRECAEQKMYDYKPVQLKGNVPIIIGYDNAGRLVSADLSIGEPHMYIAGTTGSGKSTALRAIITNLIVTAKTELYLVDLKNGVEFGMFRHAVKSLARTEEQAEALLTDMLAEVERRYNILYEANCESIAQYNKTHHMPYGVLIIDEFATLIGNKTCQKLLEQLTAKARACGIHVILSTQRPDKEVLNGRIKANVTTVLGLKAIDKTNSRVIIDHDGLERLCGYGQGVFARDGKEVTVQCPYISTEDAKAIIQPYNTQPDKSPPKRQNGGYKNVNWA